MKNTTKNFFSTNLNETYQYMLLSENKLKNYAANNAEYFLERLHMHIWK